MDFISSMIFSMALDISLVLSMESISCSICDWVCTIFSAVLSAEAITPEEVSMP